MKHNRNPLASAISYALGAGMVVSLAVTASPVLAQDEEGAELDRIQVTGSRISRADVEGATPVLTISREDIDATGYQSIADVLRNQSFNVFGSFREDSGTTIQGQAFANLRGLGSNRTLVLLNGRRLPGSPVADGQVQNLNAIPFAAVERIEILSDGASAVYGSDAIGGVINIILRSDFEGAELTYRTQLSDREGGDEELISVVGGIAGPRGNITYALEWSDRDIIFSRDREFFASANVDSADINDTRGVSIAARTILRAASGYARADAMASDCTIYGDGHLGSYTDVFRAEGSTVCGYDYTAIMAETAALERTNIFMDANYEINNDVSFWARGQYSEVESFGRYAPAAGGFFSPADLPERVLDDGTVLPPIFTNDYILYRFDNTGPARDTTQVDAMIDLQAGFQGHIGDNVRWEASYQHNTYRMSEWGDGYVNILGLISGIQAGWDPRVPDQSEFEPLVADMRENANRRAEMITDRFDVGVQFDGPTIGTSGLPVSFFVGAEYREEEYFDQTQFQAEARNILGTAGGSSSGERDVFAVFAEANLPVTDTLEFDLAARYDDYSDFGTNVVGKVAARWRPTEQILLRASYGTGFRAPSLDQLFQAPSQGFAFGRDVAQCLGGTISQVGGSPTFEQDLSECLSRPLAQHQTFFGNNPNLDAEDSEQFNLGVVVDFSEWIGQNLSMSLDYYWIEITDQIQSIGVQDILWLHFLEEIAGVPGLEYNSPGGQPTPHISQPTNFADFDTSGIDLSIDYAQNFGDMGTLTADFTLSYVLEFNDRFTILSEKQDFTKLTANSWRADTTLGYTFGDHSLQWHVWHVPGSCEATTLDTDTLADLSLQARCTTDGAGNRLKVGSFTHHNLQYNWETPINSTVTIGINNVADKMPPIASDGETFSKALYPFVGRQYVLQYRQRF